MTRDANFRHVLKCGDSFWVADRIDTLTALCGPTLRRRDGQIRIDYELLLVVVEDLQDPLASLKSAIGRGRYVGLPKVYDSRHTLDTFAVDDALTPWLINEMLSDMDRLTMGRDTAIEWLQHGEDKFVRGLKLVFQDRFVRDIVQPLESLA